MDINKVTLVRISLFIFELFVWAIVVSFIVAIDEPEIFIGRWFHIFAGLPLMSIKWFMNNIFMRNASVLDKKEKS